MKFSNECITVLCRKYLHWKFSLSLNHHRLQRYSDFQAGIFHVPHWRAALAFSINHYLLPFLSHVPIIPCAPLRLRIQRGSQGWEATAS